MSSYHIDIESSEPNVIVLEMHYQFMRNYNYLVVDPLSRQAVIVDPAWEVEKIDRALSDENASLSGILITHGHPDHIHLASFLAERYSCPIWMSKIEIASSGFHAEQLIAIDETPWALGHMLIRPIFTPGHTSGCFCYQIGDNLFTGDVLFAEGCGLCPDRAAAQAMYNSLQNLKGQLKPRTRIFPGHSYGKAPGQLFSQVLQDNIYLQFSDSESFADFRLRPKQNRAKMFDFS